MTLPEYIQCHNKYIVHCDYYMHEDCPETCGYAKDIKGKLEDDILGIGAMDEFAQNKYNVQGHKDLNT